MVPSFRLLVFLSSLCGKQILPIVEDGWGAVSAKYTVYNDVCFIHIDYFSVFTH
jgi:hypothetical protein